MGLKLLQLALAIWERRPMRRQKRGNKMILEAEMNFIAMICLIIAAGFYIKGAMGVKTGTELAIENLRVELRGYVSIAESYKGHCDQLEKRVVNLELQEFASTKGAHP